MREIIFKIGWLVLIVTFFSTGPAMELEWVKTTAQWPAERGPLVADYDNDGKEEIIIVNRGGQLLLWHLDGTPIGNGQDGQVFQMPEGRWTSRPVFIKKAIASRLVFCSVEGLVVSLDENFENVFEYQLPGTTTWGYALPAIYDTESGPAICYGDNSGTITCLNDAGLIRWQTELNYGKCNVPLQSMISEDGTFILAALGSTLCCLNTRGQVVWSSILDDRISTQPEVVNHQNSQIIVCGSKDGSLYGLNLRGQRLWTTNIGDEVNVFLSLYPRKNLPPLILCTGLWGNLHAFDIKGGHEWTHRYRAKGRGVPLVVDADGDDDKEILVSNYAQHVYIFNENGHIVDNVRLSGAINSSPVPIFDPQHDRYDVLFTTASLLAFRLRPGVAQSPYGIDALPENIELDLVNQISDEMLPSIIVHNPAGALIGVNVELIGSGEDKIIMGCVSVGSQFEIPLDTRSAKKIQLIRAEIRDAKQNLLIKKDWQILPEHTGPTVKIFSDTFNAWSTAAFDDFNPDKLVPQNREFQSGFERKITLNTMYINETEAAAFVLSSTEDKSTLVRILIENPQSRSGKPFKGNIKLHQVIPVGSVNGEIVSDAIPELNSAGIVTVPAKQAVKIILNTDTEDAQAGRYQGKISIIHLKSVADTIKFTLDINVVDLKLPDQFPLTLCTWDYVPNRWFSDNTKLVLDDMGRHGVNIFPRHPIPRATCDETKQLQVNWTDLDIELERLKGRGTILFQISRPPIEYTGEISGQQKHDVEVKYIREMRDHLREKGWDYADYALYPLDEPGLHHGKNVPILLDAARLFREADPKLRIYTDPVPGLSLQDFEQIEPYLDIWCPNMRLVSGLLANDPRIIKIMKSNQPVWSYECVSNVKTLSPLRYNRANAWRAKYFKLDGIGLWTYSQTNKDHWFAGESINDEYALVYPGEMPVSSLRWEAVRDGLEDIAAINLLENYIEQNRLLDKNQELILAAKNYLRIALNDMMESSDLAFVEARDYLKEGDRRIWHTLSDLETVQKHRQEIARLTMALKAENIK